MILQKTKKNALQKLLSAALNEKDVENAWRGFLVSAYEDSSFTSPCSCDGLFTAGPVTVLCEFKWTTELRDVKGCMPVIAQVVHYLEKFIAGDIKLPDVIFIGDKNECFVLPTSTLLRYAKDKKYPFGKYSPSEAGKNLPLMADLLKDESITPVVFDIDDKFSWDVVHAFLLRQVTQQKADLPITSKNLPNVFEYWAKHVMKGSVDENENIEVFYRVLSSPQSCFLHPKKEGSLVTGDKEYKVSKKGYNAFFSLYKETHNPVELRDLTANKDRLMTEAKRRRTGSFFTPSDWVDEAHRMLEASLGPNYRDEYVFWDCSAGSANLTRDYAFKELYLSTLEEVDIGIIREAGYNPGALVFQFDFLNGDLDTLPELLLAALRSGRKFCFLNNPPYGTANSLEAVSGGVKDKAGLSDTVAGNEMKIAEIGACSNQLYTQFLFRVNQLVEKHGLRAATLATFNMNTFLCSAQFKGFRQKVLSSYGFDRGMLFQASHFSDVSDAWGILFSIFKRGGEKKPHVVELKDYDDTGRIVVTGTKELYNLDDTRGCDAWVREGVKGLKTSDAPQLTSAIAWNQEGRGALVKDSLGYFLSIAGNVGKNTQGVALFSGTLSMAHGLSILPANFDRVVVLFAARRLIESDWKSEKDEYMVPNERHESYRQFVNDAIVFSLFESKSQQSSLRSITYKEKQWNILNHFFWMDIATLKKLALDHSNMAVYNDIIAQPGNRFVHTKLKTTPLSPDAQELLDLASSLVVDSFPMRQVVNEMEPKFHLNTWDAGWYQIRNGILKEQFPERYKEFGLKFKAFASRLRPLVYELGFLRR